MIDSKGEQVASRRATNVQESINAASWAAGSYLLRVVDNGDVIYTGKFVKE